LIKTNYAIIIIIIIIIIIAQKVRYEHR